MLVVSMVLLVLVVVALVVAGARISRLTRSLGDAERTGAGLANELARAEQRTEEADARSDGLGAELAAGAARLAELEAANEQARAEVAEAHAGLEAAEAAGREAATLVRGAQAEVEQARRRAQAAEDAAAGHPGWAEVLGRLEVVRAARTWRTVAPLGDLPGGDDADVDALSRGLEVELQWLRDVVGTPGQLSTLDGHDPAPASGPAGLVALLVAQEVLDVVGKRVEALDVAYARGEGDVRLTVSSPEAEHPVDPDGRLDHLATILAPLGAELLTEVGEGPGVTVRLVVPVARTG